MFVATKKYFSLCIKFYFGSPKLFLQAPPLTINKGPHKKTLIDQVHIVQE